MIRLFTPEPKEPVVWKPNAPVTLHCDSSGISIAKESDDNFPMFLRAGGDCICRRCGKKYKEHPNHPDYKWLNKICDGLLVKL